MFFVDLLLLGFLGVVLGVYESASPEFGLFLCMLMLGKLVDKLLLSLMRFSWWIQR